MVYRVNDISNLEYEYDSKIEETNHPNIFHYYFKSVFKL